MYDYIQIAGLTEKEKEQVAKIYIGKKIIDVSDCQTDLIATSGKLILLNLLFIDKDIGIDEAFNFDFAGIDKYAVIEDLSYKNNVNFFDNFADTFNYIAF